jgi:hypothetical protein
MPLKMETIQICSIEICSIEILLRWLKENSIEMWQAVGHVAASLDKDSG